MFFVKPITPKRGLREYTRMVILDAMEAHERLRTLRRRVGLTQVELAQRLGTTQQTVQRLERGNRSLMRWIDRLAKALDVPPHTFLGDETPGLVPLLGYVGAGDEVIPLDHDVEWVSAPPDLGEAGAALDVRGESMLPRLQPGDRVFYRQKDLMPVDAVGRVCIVQVDEGPLLIKMVQRGAKRGLFDLVSYNRPDVIADQKLLWAARLAWIRCAG